MIVLLNIPNYEFDNDIKDKFQDYFNRVKQDIADGTLCGNYELETTDMFLASFKRLQVLPDNATNGNMMKHIFSNVPVKIFEDMNTVIFGNTQFDLEWWNAPYTEKRGGENE